MTIPTVLNLSSGNSGRQKSKYYLYETYNTIEEAKEIAKKIKMERKGKMNVKYFVLEIDKGRLLESTQVALYLNKKLKII